MHQGGQPAGTVASTAGDCWWAARWRVAGGAGCALGGNLPAAKVAAACVQHQCSPTARSYPAARHSSKQRRHCQQASAGLRASPLRIRPRHLHQLLVLPAFHGPALGLHGAGDGAHVHINSPYFRPWTRAARTSEAKCNRAPQATTAQAQPPPWARPAALPPPRPTCCPSDSSPMRCMR